MNANVPMNVVREKKQRTESIKFNGNRIGAFDGKDRCWEWVREREKERTEGEKCVDFFRRISLNANQNVIRNRAATRKRTCQRHEHVMSNLFMLLWFLFPLNWLNGCSAYFSLFHSFALWWWSQWRLSFNLPPIEIFIWWKPLRWTNEWKTFAYTCAHYEMKTAVKGKMLLISKRIQFIEKVTLPLMHTRTRTQFKMHSINKAEEK